MVFQPSIFSGYVSFRECFLPIKIHLWVYRFPYIYHKNQPSMGRVSSMEFFSHLHTSHPPKVSRLDREMIAADVSAKGEGREINASIPFGTSTPWKINGWKLQITHLERKISKRPWLYSMLCNLQGCTLTEINSKSTWKRWGFQVRNLHFQVEVYFQVLRRYVSFRECKWWRNELVLFH